jgi:hypothetical protein
MLQASLQPTSKKESYTAVTANKLIITIQYKVCAELNIALGQIH